MDALRKPVQRTMTGKNRERSPMLRTASMTARE
jgi:hypothetical protein